LGWRWATPPKSADPFFLVLASYWYPRSVSWIDYTWFVAVTGAISAILIVLAVVRIRNVCSRVNVKKPSRLAKIARSLDVWRLMSRTIPWLTPSLDGNPVFWREWNRGGTPPR
jgi:hypothetical protein